MSKINVKYQDAYSYNLDNTYMKKWEPAKYDSKVSEAENEELTSSISGNKTEEAEDKKDDKKVAKKRDEKKISRFGSFIKGVGNFFKGMVCDENGKFSIGQTLKTIGIGAAIAAASILIPGAGTVIAYGALAIAAKHGVEAGINLYNAESEEEINNAWENVGSAATEGVLAYTGAKAAGAKPIHDIRTVGSKGIKAVSKFGKDIYRDYKVDGFEGVASGLKTKGSSLGETVTTKARNLKNKTVDNFNELNNSARNTERANARYDEKISRAEGQKKDNLKAQKDSYNKGVDAVKTGDNYETVYKAVQGLKEDMNTAKAKATEPNATDADIQAYKEAKAKYDGAKQVFDDRVNSGEFKAATEADKTQIAGKFDEASKARTEAAKELETAKENLRKNPDDVTAKNELKAAEDKYNQANNNYKLAASKKNASEGGHKYSTNTVRLTKEIFKHKLLTVTLAGRGKQDHEEELQYIA